MAKSQDKPVVYGIPNCDTVKKARTWLEKHNIPYQFHDFRADGLQAAQVKSWIKDLGTEQLINKRSTTWKNLSETERNNLDNDNVVTLILANPTLIKRPLLELPVGGGKMKRQTGFKDMEWKSIFSK